MSYTNAGNAAFRITAFAFGSNSFAGKIAFGFEKGVMREVLQTDNINYPEARPIDNQDSRCTIEALSWDTLPAEDASADDISIDGEEAHGGSWSIDANDYVVGGFRLGVRRRGGGNPVAQDLEQEGPYNFSVSM